VRTDASRIHTRQVCCFDVCKGTRKRLTSEERRELAALRGGKRRLEVENEILRRARRIRAGERPARMIYPVVVELAAGGIPVAGLAAGV
jgi:hypothetical protein